MNIINIRKDIVKLTCATLMASSFALVAVLAPIDVAQALDKVVTKETIVGPHGGHFHYKHVKKIPSTPKKVIMDRKVITTKKG